MRSVDQIAADILRDSAPPATIPAVEPAPPEPDRLSALEAQMAALMEAVGTLTRTLAQPDAQTAASVPTAPVELQEREASPLVKMNDENWRRRRALVDAAQLIGADAECMTAHGARGLYRRNRAVFTQMPRPTKIALIEDAQTEDPREAQQMGADLLKFWDTQDQSGYNTTTDPQSNIAVPNR